MIHHYNGQAAPDASKPNWWLRLGVILLCSTLIGLLYLWLGGYFIIPFVWTATFLLCLMRGIDLTESYSPHIRFTDWLHCRCNSWRCTRRGILLHCDDAPGPALFLPWNGIFSVTTRENGIFLDSAETDERYFLPCSGAEKEAEAAHIAEQMSKHGKHIPAEEEYKRAAFFTSSPFDIPCLPFLKTATPCVLLSLLYPWLPESGLQGCLLCFALTASLASTWHEDIEEKYCPEYYIGEKIRQSKRGLVIRQESGGTCCLPWSCIAEHVRTGKQNAFLRMHGCKDGLLLKAGADEIPLPVSRSYMTNHRWLHRVARFALILLAAAAGLLWWVLWN